MNEKQQILVNTLEFLGRVTIKGDEIEDFYICKQYLISLYNSFEERIEPKQPKQVKEQPKKEIQEEPEETKHIKTMSDLEKEEDIKEIDPDFTESTIKTSERTTQREEDTEEQDNFLDKVKNMMKGGK